MSRSRARALGAELRKHRDDAKMRLVDLGTRVGLSKSTIARIETGEKLPDDTDLAAILGALGVSGSRRDELLKMARDAQRPNWLASGIAGLPEQLTTLLDYESTAQRITEVGLLLIPGLLQTADYARAVHVATGVPAGEIETRVKIRLGRQDIVTRRDPVQFSALIDESALRRPIGGAAVMVEQLRHIQRMAERSNVSIQVLPYGAHSAIEGSFVLLEFADQLPVVHVEHHRASAFLDEPEDVQDYSALTEKIRQEALSPAESAGLVSEAIAELETT